MAIILICLNVLLDFVVGSLNLVTSSAFIDGMRVVALAPAGLASYKLCSSSLSASSGKFQDYDFREAVLVVSLSKFHHHFHP
jgi:hypothetical protein